MDVVEGGREADHIVRVDRDGDGMARVGEELARGARVDRIVEDAGPNAREDGFVAGAQHADLDGHAESTAHARRRTITHRNTLATA